MISYYLKEDCKEEAKVVVADRPLLLISLARSIGGYTGAPSERQIQNITKNTERLMALVEKINLIIDQDVLRLNKLMIENNIPYIAPLERIKRDQKGR